MTFKQGQIYDVFTKFHYERYLVLYYSGVLNVGYTETYYNGKLTKQVSYNKDSQIDGVYKRWDRFTGKLMTHQIFKDGTIIKELVND